MNSISHASIVGSLMSVMVCTRPNISYRVSFIRKYMANSWFEKGLHVVKVCSHVHPACCSESMFKHAVVEMLNLLACQIEPFV